jgi:uncharacterized protein YndB with AHSA1/START domain
MPSARATRTIAASAQELWELICDPHHLPRWWPRVERVEDVRDHAFTEVMRTSRGKVVRADFTVGQADRAALRVVWDQRVQGTPFERVLRSSRTEIALAPLGGGLAASGGGGAAPGGGLAAPGCGGARTEVTIELRQELGSDVGGIGRYLPKLGAFMVKRAGQATLEEALAGLERIYG